MVYSDDFQLNISSELISFMLYNMILFVPIRRIFLFHCRTNVLNNSNFGLFIYIYIHCGIILTPLQFFTFSLCAVDHQPALLLLTFKIKELGGVRI